jgi:hypothetical protein
MAVRLVEDKVIQPESEVPVIERADVVVAGGGVAGFAAAASAAREGVSVILVERYGYLGGMVTGGLVVHLEGFGDGKSWVIKGIGEELIDTLREEGGARVSGYDVTIDPELLKCILFRITKGTGVRALLHSTVTDVILKDGRVHGVIVENISGRGAILGSVVIDTTGDGDVFAKAGAEFDVGRRGFGLIFRLSNVNQDKIERFKNERPDEYNAIIQEIRGLLGFPILGAREVLDGVIWWSNMTAPKDGLDTTEISAQEIEIRENILKVVRLVKERVPGFEEAQLIQTASQFGVRETRRLVGEFIITEEDIKKGLSSHEAIAHGGYGAEAGIGYDIPYGVLVPRGVDGLLVAGRCISCDEFSQNLLRVVANCIATGQGAGVASGIAIKDGVEVRDVDRERLRDRLMAQDVLLK